MTSDRDRRRPPGCRVLALALAGLLAAACARRRETYRIAAPDPATRRSTPAGELVGGEGRYGSHAWLGIPFAKPPVGDLRWRPAEPAARWDGLREALAFGAPCPQYASPFGGVVDAKPGTPVGSEDCLTLSVWAPRFAPADVPRGGARLPVMVWLHGGGNTIGHIGFYEGGRLAATEGLIVVTVQYRLGPFGWFRHAALRAGAASDLERSGNYGTLDQVRGLEWVRDNVSAFGGDPGNVTVFGESAGAYDALMLLLAPQARGLFHRAIAESGGLWTDTPAAAEHAIDDPEPGHAQGSTEILLRLLQRDGRAADRAAARARVAAMSDTEIAAYLRGQSTQAILTAYDPLPGVEMIDMPRVFGDGVVLPAGDLLPRLARDGGTARVPVMLGTNRDESKIFMFGNPALVRRWLWIVPRLVDEPRYQASAEYGSRMWKAMGADEPAAALAQAHGPDVFVYRFDWRDEPTILGADLAKMLGASHGFEIPFVFGHFDLGPEGNVMFTDANAAGRETLARAIMGYWAQFARTGAPGRGRDGGLPEWNAWDGPSRESPKTLLLDVPAGSGIRMSPLLETRAGVLADVDRDPRLRTPKERCRVYHELAQYARAITRDDYGQRCAAFPYDAYPWPN